MNIRQRRLQILVEKVLKEELQKGNLPSSREFIQRIRDFIQNNKIDKPFLQVRPIRKNDIARAEEINTLIDQSYEDLKILYESIIGKYDTALKNFNQFEVEKAKLDYELNKLENHLKELILLYGESGFLTSVYDVFDDLSKVDAEKTTCEINLKAHECTLQFSKNTSHKVSTQNAIPYFYLSSETRAKAVSTKTIGNVTYGLSENIDEVWAEVVYLKENYQEVEGTYEIHFDGEVFCNNVEIEPHAGKSVELKIEYSPDGTNWRDVPYNEKEEKVEGVVTYHFNHIHMHKFRIRMRKKEADHSTIPKDGDQTLLYAYVMGIKKISFYQTGYADYGEFYSKPLSPTVEKGKPFTISQVSLYVDEVCPNGTSIDYFIAIHPEAPGEEPEWKPISPVNHEAPKYDQIIDFKNISRSPATTFSISKDISIGEYRLDSLYANGIQFYKIGEIQGKKIVDGSEKLFIGKNSWGVKMFQWTFEDGHLPNLPDWRTSAPIYEYYKTMEDGKAGVLLDKEEVTLNSNYMFTLGVFSRRSEQIVSATPVSLDPIVIYMNGEKIFEGIPNPTTKVNYLFKPRWNEIKVLAYVSNTVGSTEKTTISLGFDPREYGSYTYAQARSLEKVPLFDLRYNVKSNDNSKFAIMESGDRYLIVINHIVPGIEYDFYADYIEGDPKTKILFKAVMKRDRAITELTPKIKSYRLRFS